MEKNKEKKSKTGDPIGFRLQTDLDDRLLSLCERSRLSLSSGDICRIYITNNFDDLERRFNALIEGLDAAIDQSMIPASLEPATQLTPTTTDNSDDKASEDR